MDTLSIFKKLLVAGFKQEQAEVIAEIVKEREDELATKKDIKDLRWLIGAGFVVIGTGFGYLLNAINNNHDLLTTIIGKLG